MPRIQCLLGPASEVTVGGTAYNFENDAHGRAVATVQDELHAQCFLSIQHYRLLPDDLILGDPASSTSLSPLGGGESEDDDDDTLQLGGQSFTPGITQPENGNDGNANPAGGEGNGSGDGTDNTVKEPDTDLNKNDSNGQGGDNSGAGAGNTEPPVPPVTPATTTTTPAAEPVKVEKPETEAAPKSRGRPKKAEAVAKPSGE